MEVMMMMVEAEISIESSFMRYREFFYRDSIVVVVGHKS